jgi:hypothetical protein
MAKLARLWVYVIRPGRAGMYVFAFECVKAGRVKVALIFHLLCRIWQENCYVLLISTV